jgi:hypothetical protein
MNYSTTATPTRTEQDAVRPEEAGGGHSQQCRESS